MISVFQICNASFATRDRLRSHLACHEDKIPCKVCGKFLRAAYMTDHLKKHSEGTHNYCGICNKGNSFKKKTALYSGSKSETSLPPILINIQRVLTSWMFTIYRLILFDILVNVLLGKIRHESRVMVDVLPCDLVIFKSKILII